MRTWMYGPKGEARIFDRREDAPRGWKDTPQAAEQVELEEARRSRDIPPGRMDRAALPPAVAGIADQVFAEVTARIAAPPTADERPISNPSSEPDRIGERPIAAAVPNPVRDQGDKQPHIERQNWTPELEAKMELREARAVAEALAGREANRAAFGGDSATARLEAAFHPDDEDIPTVDEVESGQAELTPEQEEAIEEVEREAERIAPAGDKQPARRARKR